MNLNAVSPPRGTGATATDAILARPRSARLAAPPPPLQPSASQILVDHVMIGGNDDIGRGNNGNGGIADRRGMSNTDGTSTPGSTARPLDISPTPTYSTPVATYSDPIRLHGDALKKIRRLFPDIRRQAATILEQRLLRDYGVRLDANQAYFNTFTSYHLEDSVEEHPEVSLSLTDLQLLKDSLDPDVLLPADEMGGIFTEGKWSTHFGQTNKIPLLPSQALAAVTSNRFFKQYREVLRNYWNDHFETLQLLGELEIERYVQEHRSEGNRAQALGLPPDLGLSDHALAMLAEATGYPFPDQPHLGTRSFLLDINGYASIDITWLCDNAGRVLLHIPGDSRPLREYPSLAAMRADVREMSRNIEGRTALARHFTLHNRGNSLFHYGVDQWLKDIGSSNGRYDYAVAYYGTSSSANKLRMTPPDENARALLSNKAVAMLSEAAGFPDPGLGTFSTRASLLDINGIAAVDLVYLEAADGHVVLLTPGYRHQVREFRNLEAMRTELARMIVSPAGVGDLARHFMVNDRRCTDTYDGIDEWLRKIRADSGQYRQHIAMDGQRHRIVDTSIFHRMAARQRSRDLDLGNKLATANWDDNDERARWVRSLETSSQFFADDDHLKRACATEIGAVPEREARSSDDTVSRCLNMNLRPMRWGQSLGQRLVLARDRLAQAEMAAMAAASAAPTVPSDTALDTPPSRLALASDRVTNKMGFMTRKDFGTLYVVTSPKNGVPTHERSRAQALEGDLVYAFFLSEEAARRMAVMRWGPLEGSRYPLYQVRANHLEGVSFGDNRANNPDYARLIHGRELDFIVDALPASGRPGMAVEDLLEEAVQIRFANVDDALHRMGVSQRGKANTPARAGKKRCT